MKNGPYEMVIAPKEYPGRKYRDRYVYEHHLVWWQNTGVVVPTGRLIHHKNGQKRDNRFENLSLETPASHGVEHKKDHWSDLECSFCGVWFQRSPRNVGFKKKQGQTRFYCSRSHAASGQSKSD